MSRESIDVAKLATTTPKKVLKVSVIYTKGRGYSLSILPIKDYGDGCFAWTVLSGCSRLLEPATRFNRARLETLAAQCEKLPMYKECVDKVLAEENLVLEVKESVPA